MSRATRKNSRLGTTDISAAIDAQHAADSSTYARMVPAPTGVAATDRANILAEHAALPASGGRLILQAGSYDLGTTGITFTKRVTVQGAGPSDPADAAYGTRITYSHAATPAITVTASGSSLAGFHLKYTGATPTTGSVGILVVGANSGDANRYLDLSIQGFHINMDVQDGKEWYMTRCYLVDPVLYGLRSAHADLTDGGDQSISDCQFMSGPTNTACAALIRYESGGGMKLSNSKFNSRNGKSAGYSFELAVADGVDSSDLLISNCSLENWKLAAIRLTLKGTTGRFSNILITGCETLPAAPSVPTILADPAIAGMIHKVGITGCCFVPGGPPTSVVSLTNIDVVRLSGITIDAYDTLLSIGPNVFGINSASQEAIAGPLTEAGYIGTQESTTSAAYGDLATVGPSATVMVGYSGRVLVTLGVQTQSQGGTGGTCNMSYAMTGANTRVAAEDNSINQNAFSPLWGGGGRTSIQTGLAPGLTTFTAKYYVNANQGNFARRSIIVMPL